MNDAVLNMLKHSKDENALDFENAFKDNMLDRITNAINNRKIEVAQSIFKDSTETEEEVETDEQPENTDATREVDKEEETNG